VRRGVLWLFSGNLLGKAVGLLREVVIAFMFGTSDAVVALRFLDARRRGVVAVANPHGMEEFAAVSLVRRVARALPRWLSRAAVKADWVVATDSVLVPEVERNLRVSAQQVVVIPNGVDIDYLRSVAELGLSGVTTRPDIVSVGRLVHNKGYDLLAEALVALARDGNVGPMVWRHFGTGPESGRLQAITARTQGLRLEIVSDASDAEVQANLAASRVFVQPSRYEGSSLTTLEAMAQGTIAVGTPVGGIPDKVRNGETGFLASGVSSHALSEAVSAALDSPRDDILQAAKDMVLERFDLRRVAESLSHSLATENSSGAGRKRLVRRGLGWAAQADTARRGDL
jgi:glycosyltransferase involved in cell wall biosynthesis